MPKKINDGLTRYQRYRRRHPERAAQITKRYRQNHPERSLAAQMSWRKRNPERWFAIRRKSSLNRSLGDGAFDHFEEQRRLQNGRCAICGELMTKACSDHNHETGQWRGVLCDCCNRSIGLLKDNVETLKSAIAYLEKWRA